MEKLRKFFKNITLSSALLILLVTTFAGDWITVGGNNQRNGQSTETGPNSALIYWDKPTLFSYWGMQIFIYGDKCVTSRYVSLSPLRAPLVCHNLNTGDTLWTRNYSANGVMVVMGFNNDNIYARNFQQQGFDTIYAINPVDGSVIWKSNFTVERGIIWSAAFASNGDLILPGSGTKSIMRINHTNGDTVWTRYRIIPNTGAECMCVYGNTVYTWEGSLVTPKRIMAIDINNGAIKYYSAALPGDGDQEIPFSVSPNGTIYAIRDGGLLYALRDNGSGFTQLWTYQPVGPIGTFSQFGVGTDSSVYVPSGRRIIRLNHTNGIPIDSSEELATTNSINPRITIGLDGKLYVSNGASNPSDGKFYSFSPSLQTLWSVPAPYNYYSGPALGSNGILVVNNQGTNIWAYRTTIGITNNGNNTPEGFKLFLNYPNPFNPKTIISYELQVTGYIKISVYDINGKHISDLVNQIQIAGKHETEFDGSNFSSGIYFYKLETDGYKDVKKMIFVK